MSDSLSTNTDRGGEKFQGARELNAPGQGSRIPVAKVMSSYSLAATGLTSTYPAQRIEGKGFPGKQATSAGSRRHRPLGGCSHDAAGGSGWTCGTDRKRYRGYFRELHRFCTAGPGSGSSGQSASEAERESVGWHACRHA